MITPPDDDVLPEQRGMAPLREEITKREGAQLRGLWGGYPRAQARSPAALALQSIQHDFRSHVALEFLKAWILAPDPQPVSDG
jgi:hypothetical protein